MTDSALVCLDSIPRFAEYPSEAPFRGPYRWPSVVLGADSLDLANRADLAISGAPRTPSFASHFAVVEWGCGSPCQQEGVIDLRTGRFLEIVDASLGAAYRLDSRLFIVNPPDSSGCYSTQCAYCTPEFYVLDADALRRIR